MICEEREKGRELLVQLSSYVSQCIGLVFTCRSAWSRHFAVCLANNCLKMYRSENLLIYALEGHTFKII